MIYVDRTIAEEKSDLGIGALSLPDAWSILLMHPKLIDWVFTQKFDDFNKQNNAGDAYQV